MLGRFIFNRIGALVIGVLILGVGLFMFSTTDVKCGSETMQQGDICQTTSNGKTVDRTYDEQKKENATSSYVALGAGGLVLLGGIVANIRHYTKKKPAPTEPAAAA